MRELPLYTPLRGRPEYEQLLREAENKVRLAGA
jgi:hypothetical protein